MGGKIVLIEVVLMYQKLLSQPSTPYSYLNLGSDVERMEVLKKLCYALPYFLHTYTYVLTTYNIFLICLYILSMNQNIFFSFFLQERNLLLLQNMGRLQRVPELWRKRKFPKTVRTSKRRVVLPNLLTCPPVRFDRFIDQFLKVRNYNPKYTLLG